MEHESLWSPRATYITSNVSRVQTLKVLIKRKKSPKLGHWMNEPGQHCKAMGKERAHRKDFCALYSVYCSNVQLTIFYLCRQIGRCEEDTVYILPQGGSHRDLNTTGCVPLILDLSRQHIFEVSQTWNRTSTYSLHKVSQFFNSKMSPFTHLPLFISHVRKLQLSTDLKQILSRILSFWKVQ